MPMIYKDVEVGVEVTLDDFDDDELVEELSKRGIDYGSPEEFKCAVQELYDLWTANKIYVQIDPSTVDINPEITTRLNQIFDIVLGRIA